MPVMNEEASVTGAIQSILKQDVTLEIIIADAGSTDGTLAAIAAIDDPRIKVFPNPQLNIPSGLNIGLLHAQGEFVARVDAHALINDSYLRTALASFDDPTVGGVGGLKNGVARTATGRAIAVALGSRFGVGNSVYHYGDHAQDTDHAAFGVYRTSLAREVRGWDESLAVNEDVDFDYRILASGYRIRFEPSMVISWSVRETFAEFGRQYRRYGRGKGQMIRKNGAAAIKWRHLAAPMLVIECGLAAACVVAGRPRVGLLLSAPYAAGLAFAVASLTRPPEPEDLRVPIGQLISAFVVMHFSWGFGFLETIVFKASPALASAR